MTVRYPLSSIEGRSARLGMVAADTGSSRLVYAMVFTLIMIGVVLLVLAVVVFRRTRVDPDVLAPLERMGSRRWRKGDPESRRSLLDAVRPAGATGPSPTGSTDALVGLPPPVIEPGREGPHDATFVAGPEGVEPVAHDEAAVPLDAEVADVPLAHDGATEPAETIESARADPAPIAADVPTDAVAAADIVPVEEAVSSDGAAVTFDDARDDPDDAVAEAGGASTGGADAPAVAEPGDTAPQNGSDDPGAPTDEGVDAPPEPVGPVDGSVGGQ